MTSNKPAAYSYIRFSTPEQAEGDSERRQTEAIQKAREYAKDEHGLELVSLVDEGISGFSGKHLTEGALGEFIAKVKDGTIAKDSLLIIENVDRLTRLKPSKAQKLLISILEAGITLVVFGVQVWEVTEDSYNNEDGDFWRLNVEIKRAHQESKRKSELGKSNWKAKREKAKQGVPLTRTCPQWCQPAEDEKGNWAPYEDEDGNLLYFEPVEEVAEVIREMFRMKAAGKGAARITNELNARDDLYKPDKGWGKATVNRYLRSKKVLGQFELHRRDENDKRVSTGEVVENYYPQIIPEDLWYEAKAVFDANAKRKGNAGGRNGAENNLFRHIDTLCKACGDGKMYFDPHGRYKYLRCQNHKRKNGCEESRSVNYESIFEPLILRYCHGLNVTDILPTDTRRQQKLGHLKSQLQSVKGKLGELNQAIENRDAALDATEKKEMISFHNEKLTELLDRRSEVSKQKESLEAQINELSTSKEQTAERLKNVRQLIERLEKVEGKERIDLRIKLRMKLQSLIDQITISFDTLEEYGQEVTAFEITFTDDVKRTLILIDDKLDEVITIEGGEIDIQDIARQRQQESDKVVARALNLAQTS